MFNRAHADEVCIHSRPEFGELVVMYKSSRGAYSECGALFSACHSLMPQYNMISVYYDDPVKVTSALSILFDLITYKVVHLEN